MASKLPVDIMSIIFDDVEQENDNTLYSCIFVSREWCQMAVPFLWKNPWKKIDYNKRDYTVNQFKVLFNCFLMMLSKESKEFLKLNGINFLVESQNNHDNSSSRTPL